MKKKIIAILLSLSIPFSMISCKESAKNVTTQNNNLASSANESSDKANSSNESNNEVSNVNNNADNKEDIKEANANIYYYDAVNDKIVYINKVIKIEEKMTATALVDELKKSPNSDIAPAISNEINLNSANVDEESSTMTLDFSSNFVQAQNLGGGAESSTIKAICNTFGSYFKVDNVIITLDGEPYSSGHILMSEGESFKVDLDNSSPLN